MTALDGDILYGQFEMHMKRRSKVKQFRVVRAKHFFASITKEGIRRMFVPILVARSLRLSLRVSLAVEEEAAWVEKVKKTKKGKVEQGSFNGEGSNLMQMLRRSF